MENFAGVGLGVLRMVVAAGIVVRVYTYIDRDPVSRKIARHVLLQLQLQYPKLILQSAIESFDRVYMPKNISLIGPAALTNLVAQYGPVDILGESWECQSGSRVGRCRGVEDPRFIFFFDLVRIINFFQKHQESPMVYLRENTYPGEDIHLNPHVKKAQQLVEAFLGPSVRLDSADMGSAAHRVRMYWTNMLLTGGTTAHHAQESTPGSFT